MDANLLNLLMANDGDTQEANGNPLSSFLPAMIPGLLSTLIGDPEMLGETLRNAASKYKPTIYALLEELFTCYEDLAKNERVFKAQAQMKWNAYAAYKQAGFTPEQSMLLLVDAEAARRNLVKQITTSISTAGANI